MANLSASMSWGTNSSTSGGLDSSLWGSMNTTSTSTSSTWGSTTAPGSLSLNQGQNLQIGASSGGDGQNTNGSASAAGWGISPVNPTGGTNPDNSQSQTGTVASSTIGQQSGPSTLASSQPASLATNTMPWHANKPFGFTPTSDTNWTNPASTAMNTTSSTTSKEGSSSIVGALNEPGKMDLAAGLANLSIGKTAPPPDWNTNLKSGWNSSMDPSKLPVGAVGSPADLSFAQATQKGLKPAIGTIRSGVLSAKEEEIRRAVNNNDGWGTRPVRQDTSWDVESSPKAARKMLAENPEVAPSNVWNNNNGTAIWESTREPPAPGWGAGASGGGTIFADKDPSNWNMPSKPNMEGTSWGGGGANPAMMNNPMGDKSIGTWGGENQPSSSKLWGNKTETGSWNEPPPERNMTWGGQDTDVGTWEDPATAAARRIVSSSGVGPMGMTGSGNGGSNMPMGSGNMPMGTGNMPMAANTMAMGGANLGMPGANNMPMGGANMPMGGANMPMGGANMPMGGANMPMGGANLPMGGSMNMAMAGSGGAMNLGAGGGMGGSNMSMPMGTNNNMNMGNNNDSSMYWNDPNAKPQGWNQAAGPPRPKPDEAWNKSGMGRPGNSNGWGDPSGNSAQKVDDGTSIWAANAQEQARAAGWGEPGAMWNPAFGARPKATSWSGGEQDNWQRKLQSQQRFPGSGGQPQMRSKLIQQLMDMGFKKEEAQNALISNNMNFESALGELTSGLHKKEADDVFQSAGSKMLRQGFMGENAGMMGEDISDNRSDSNPHVPNFPMQNTPFNNAQVTNPSYMSAGMNMYDHRSKGGPPMPPANSSLNNNLQHKLKVMQQQQGGNSGASPALNSLSPGQVRGGNVPGSSNQSMVQQQAAQQQILQQLRLAVQSGLISPQLLNYQLPHNILVMLQQLLQLQNALQNLIQRQQFLQQNKVALNIPRPQLEQVSVMIGQYKSQILGLQKQLQAAQQNMLMKQQPPTAPTPTPPQMQAMSQQPPLGMPPPIPTSMQGEGGESMLSLPGDIGGTSSAASMSRLSQWKQPTMEKEGQGDLNKAPGSKPQQGLQHSHSAPVMGPFGDLPSLNIGGDSTWSSLATSTSSSWPSAPAGDGGAEEGSKREDGTPPTSGLASMLGGGGNLGLSTDVIPEFVPGKPWQGLSSKSVEDDPHITPGSISRSLSVNVVKDDYLNNLTAASKSSPSFTTDPTWSTGDKPGGMGAAETSMANAMTLGASNLQALQNRSSAANNQWQQSGGIYSRQHSWAGRSPSSAFTQVSGSGWDSRQSSWLLKSLPTQDEDQ